MASNSRLRSRLVDDVLGLPDALDAQAVVARRAVSSLVPCEPDDVAWRVSNPAAAPSVRKVTADDGSGYHDLAWINADLVAPPSGYIERPFTVPSGVTAVTLSCDLKLPGGGTPNPVLLQILDSFGVTVVGSQSVTPSGSLVRASTNGISVTAGVEYRARIVFNSAGQGDALVGDIRVTPTAGSGFFASGFKRVPCDQRTLIDSNESGWATPRYPSQSEYSHIDLVTDATTLVVEAFNNGSYYLTNDAVCSVFVNGRPYTTFTPSADVVSYNTITLPSGTKRVSIVSSIQASGSTLEPTNRGSFLIAVYAASSDILSPLPPPLTRERIVLYGDSKFAGSYSSVPSRDGLCALLRARGHRVIDESYGGRALQTDTSGTPSAASCEGIARKITKHAPTLVVLGIGRNDFYVPTYSQANWSTQLGNLVDQIHAMAPGARVYLVKFTRETSEPNNGSGDTMDGWRGIMDTVASTRSYVSVLPGDQLWTIADAGSFTSDGVHPNDRGYNKLASLIDSWVPAITGGLVQLGEPYPWTPKELGSSLLAWWSPSLGLTAGSMSTVSSTGTSPPTVTLSGTPTVVGTLVIAVTTGGARGTAKFRWSMDGGVSWVQNQVTTAASVALGTTGLTANFAVGTYVNDNVYTALTRLSQVNDQSGNGHHLVQATGANQFALSTMTVTGVPKGQPAFHPNGATCFMTASGFTLTNPFTVYSVAKLTSQASIRTLFSGSSGNNIFLYSNTGTTMAINAGAQISASVTATNPHVYGAIFNGGSSALRVDGASAVSGAAGSNSPTSFTLGFDAVGVQWPWDGPIGDTLIVNGAATSVQQALIEAWFRNKYRTW